MASVDTIGLAPDADGKTEASMTKRRSVPQTSPSSSTTESQGSTPMRHVPIWCAEKMVAPLVASPRSLMPWIQPSSAALAPGAA